jgi:hypothetical protein
MRSSIACALGCATLLASPFCLAQQADFGPLPYDYFTANLVMYDLDETGIEIGASFEVANRTHVFAEYADHELGNGFDRTTLQIGGGYRWDLRPNLDFVAKLALADTEIDVPGIGNDFEDEGLIVSGALRGWVNRNLELSGELLLDDSVGSSTETILEFGGQFYLRGNLSVGGRIRTDEDDTSLFLGARFYFGDSARRRQ